MIGPIARLILRYGVGALFGVGVGVTLAGDQDVVDVVSAGLTVAIPLVSAIATEAWYCAAKRFGWRT